LELCNISPAGNSTLYSLGCQNFCPMGFDRRVFWVKIW
jgi:hypothetical protein